MKTENAVEPVSHISRFYGAFWCAFVGDALGIPSHGYTKKKRIRQDYGEIHRYTKAITPHPQSVLFHTTFELAEGKNDILHGRDSEWRVPGTHFHQHLEAGDNSLNLLLALELSQHLAEKGSYDQLKYTERYLRFMLNSESHRDTYIPQAHLRFFENYGKGISPLKCGEEAFAVGGIVNAFPLMLLHHNHPKQAITEVRKHLHLTHRGESLARSADLIVDLLCYLLKGYDIETALYEKIKGNLSHPALNFPYRRWRDNHTDDEVACELINNTAHIDDSIPLVIYLALKYESDIATALKVSANLGGATCPRGALLGLLLGARHGSEEIPTDLIEGLVQREHIDRACDGIAAIALSD